MRSHIIIVAFALALPSVVYAGMIPERMNLYSAARYSELKQLVEKEVKDDPQPPSYKLIYLCLAYSNLKEYTKLFHCLGELENNIRRGDTAFANLTETPMLALTAFAGSIFAGREGMRGDVTPFLYLLRSDAYTELRDYDKAIVAAKQAEAAIPKIWNQERAIRIKVLTALGLSHAFAGKGDEAEKYAESLSTLSTAFPYVALADDKVTGLARIYIALGKYKKAYDGLRSDSPGIFKPLLEFGDALGGAMVGMGGESTFTYVELPKQYMAAKTLLEVGEIKQAKNGYDRLLQLHQIADNGEIYWLLLFDRGRIAADEGDLPAAIKFWKKAVEVIEQQRSTINTEANKIGFVGDKQVVYKKLIAALVQTQQLPDAFDYLERSKSRALVDMLASKKDFAVPDGNATKMHELLTKVEQAEMDARAQDVVAATSVETSSQTDQISQPTLSATASSPVASGQRSLVVSPVKQAIAEIPSEVASLVSVSSTPIEEIQARIPEDEVLVEYYYDDKSLFIFMLSRRGLQAVRTDAGNLGEEAKVLRATVADPKSEAYLPAAQQLYQQLVKPIEPLLAGRSKLIIIPQGVLHYVPFAVLHDGSQFLIDKYAFRLLPSASVVKYLRDKPSRKPGGILAFGNPDLGDSKYDLRFAEEEAKAIIQTIPESRAVLRKEATEAALRENAAGFNYLHFATHGEFNAGAPLNSALILAKDASSDGLLTVNKLYSMRLDIDLATLSACETGLGKIANGDDVVGLTRGFLFAGTSTIVASLWQVDDQATSELMKWFYEGLKDKNKRDALRQAQLYARDKYAHPYYWAAFQLTGNSQ